MSLNLSLQDGRSQTRTLVLDGRLDNATVEAFDEALSSLLAAPVQVAILDLTRLVYVSSIGLRSIFGAQKAMHARGGKTVLLNPTPQVKKVLEIVQVPEFGVVFKSVQELDAYLDAMQKKVAGGD